jgi:hypothetical protein
MRIRVAFLAVVVGAGIGMSAPPAMSQSNGPASQPTRGAVDIPDPHARLPYHHTQPVAAGSGPVPTLILGGPAYQITPAKGRDFIMWASGDLDAPREIPFDIFVRHGNGIRRLNPAGTSAYGGGVDGHAVVYQQIDPIGTGGVVNSQLMWNNVKTGRTHGFAKNVNTRAWEYAPSVSGNWLLFGRTRAGWCGGQYKIFLYNTDTRELRNIAKTPCREDSELYVGQINGNFAVWTKRSPDGWDVFRHDVMSGITTRIAQQDEFFAHYAPSVTRDGTVYFARSGDGCGLDVEIARQSIGAPSEVLLDIPDGWDLPSSYVFERSGGVVDLYYDLTDCWKKSDIYRLRLAAH